jgi:hypothetical protein
MPLTILAALQVVYSESTSTDHITIGNPAPVFLHNSSTLLLPFCRNNLQIYLTNSSDGGEEPAGGMCVRVPGPLF